MVMTLYVIQMYMTIDTDDWDDIDSFSRLAPCKAVFDATVKKFPFTEYRIVQREVETREDDKVLYSISSESAA